MSWTSALEGAGNWLGGGGFFPTLVRVVIGYSLIQYLNKKPDDPATGFGPPPPGSRQQVPAATSNKIPVVYGDAYLSGIITDMQLTNNNKQMWAVITLCEETGNLLSTSALSNITIDDIYMNNQKVVFNAGGKVIDYLLDDTGVVDTNPRNLVSISLYRGSNDPMLPCLPGTTTPIPGTVPPFAYQNMPGWDSSYTMENLVFAIVQVNYDPSKGIRSIPALKFHVRNNLQKPGDVLHDYMTNVMYGAGLPANTIDTTKLVELNSYSDETVCYADSTPVTAGSFVASSVYQISSIGTTDYTTIGAVSNTVGTFFTASGAGTGTGTAYLVTPVASPSLIVGVRYTIATLGTSNFTLCGASANTIGTSFIATKTTPGTGTCYTDYSGSRYQINGVVQTGNTVLTNMQKIAETAGSDIVYDITTGKWSLFINKLTPQTLTFNNSNIIGPVLLASSNMDQFFNSIEVQFPYSLLRDQTNFLRVDLPLAIQNPNELPNTYQKSFDYSNNVLQSTILANLSLRQNREDLLITFNTDFSMLNAQIGDVFGIDNDVYGWVGKQFRVLRLKKVEGENGSLVLEVTAQSYNPDVYTVESITDFVPLIGAGRSLPSLGAISTPVKPTTYTSTVSSQPSITIYGVVPSGIVTEMEYWVSSNAVSQELSDGELQIGQVYTIVNVVPLVNAGNFVIGTSYRIESAGTTNWVAIGAADNLPDTEFIATGVGIGNGTASVSGAVRSDWTTVGAVNNNAGTKFIATLTGTSPGGVLAPGSGKVATEATAIKVIAGNFVIGKTYSIGYLGSTDFTTIGAAVNQVGLTFIATGAGSGTGWATETVYELIGTTRSANSGAFETGAITSFKTALLLTGDYTFKVRAANAYGTSEFSVPSDVVHYEYSIAPSVLPYSVPMGSNDNSSALPAAAGMGLGLMAGYLATKLNWFQPGGILGNTTPVTPPFAIGSEYTVVTLGTTDFSAIGGANTIGNVFIAKGHGSGTGTAKVNMTAKSVFGITDASSAAIKQAVAADGGTANVTPGFSSVDVNGTSFQSSNSPKITFTAGQTGNAGTYIHLTTLPGTNTVVIDLAAAPQAVNSGTGGLVGSGTVASVNTTTAPDGTITELTVYTDGSTQTKTTSPTGVVTISTTGSGTGGGEGAIAPNTFTLNGNVFPALFGTGSTIGVTDSRAGIFTHNLLAFGGANVLGANVITPDHAINHISDITVSAGGIIQNFYNFPTLTSNPSAWSKPPNYDNSKLTKYDYLTKVSVYYSTATYTSGNLLSQSWSNWTLLGSNDGVTGFKGVINVPGTPGSSTGHWSNPPPDNVSTQGNTAPYIVEELLTSSGTGSTTYIDGTFDATATVIEADPYYEYDPFKPNIWVVDKVIEPTANTTIVSDNLAKTTVVATGGVVPFQGGVNDLIIFGISPYNLLDGTPFNSNTVFGEVGDRYVNTYRDAVSISQIVNNGSRFVGLDSNTSSIYWSDNGKDFIRVKDPLVVDTDGDWAPNTLNVFRFVIHDGTKFIAYNMNNRVTTSTDGKYWIEYATTHHLNNLTTCVIGASGKYLAVNPGGYQTSVDGLDWVATVYPLVFEDGVPNTCVWDGTQFLIGSTYENGKGSAMYSSPTGTTWSKVGNVSNPALPQSIDPAKNEALQAKTNAANVPQLGMLP